MKLYFKNKLMTVGPAEIEADIAKLGAAPMVYNRTPEFSEFFRSVHSLLQYFFQTKNPVYTLASSGTGAMEAAISNTMSPGDTVVVIARGKFGMLWKDIAEAYGLKVKLMYLSGQQQPTMAQLKAAITPKVRGVFTNANETSIGVKTDVAAIGKYVKKTKAIFVVDAISSIGADEFKSDAWHCDMIIASSQKALALPPGLAFVSVSAKARRLFGSSRLPKFYFDLKKYEANLQRGQTPFTPAISLLYQLLGRLKKIKRAGLNSQHRGFAKRVAVLGKVLKAWGLKPVPQKCAANCMIAVRLPASLDAMEIIKSLKQKYGIQLSPNPPGPEQNVLRIGLMGIMTTKDLRKFLTAFRKCLQSAGYAFPKSKT